MKSFEKSTLMQLSENSVGNENKGGMYTLKSKSPLIPPIRTSGTFGLSRKGGNGLNWAT
jgi:hypothetical protein